MEHKTITTIFDSELIKFIKKQLDIEKEIKITQITRKPGHLDVHWKFEEENK